MNMNIIYAYNYSITYKYKIIYMYNTRNQRDFMTCDS